MLILVYILLPRFKKKKKKEIWSLFGAKQVELKSYQAVGNLIESLG